MRGSDYDSTTETFRYNVKRWARAHDLEVELQLFPALDGDGREIPVTKEDPVALGVRFLVDGNGNGNGARAAGNGNGSGGRGPAR